MVNNKKQILQKAILSAAIVGSAFILAQILSANSTQGLGTINEPGLTLPESYLGEKTMIADAKQNAKFEVKAPTDLPQSTSVKDVYMSDDGTRVLILYSNPTMNTIDNAGGATLPVTGEIVLSMGAQETNPIPAAKSTELLPMRILVKEEGGQERLVAEIPQTQTNLMSVTINGMEGIGIDAASDTLGNRQPARVIWWDDGVLYTLAADLELPELVRIAESVK